MTDTVRVIRSIVDKDEELQVMIDDADTPTLLADADNGFVLKANARLCNLFGVPQAHLKKGALCDLLTKGMAKPAARMRKKSPLPENGTANSTTRQAGAWSLRKQKYATWCTTAASSCASASTTRN